jgi:hypothetical protein
MTCDSTVPVRGAAASAVTLTKAKGFRSVIGGMPYRRGGD